jgi:hypothetical protein
VGDGETNMRDRHLPRMDEMAVNEINERREISL